MLQQSLPRLLTSSRRQSSVRDGHSSFLPSPSLLLTSPSSSFQHLCWVRCVSVLQRRNKRDATLSSWIIIMVKGKKAGSSSMESDCSRAPGKCLTVAAQKEEKKTEKEKEEGKCYRSLHETRDAGCSCKIQTPDSHCSSSLLPSDIADCMNLCLMNPCLPSPEPVHSRLTYTHTQV